MDSPAPPARRLRGVAGIAGVMATGLALAGCGASAQTSSVTVSGKSLTVFISAPAGYASQPMLAATVAGEQLAYRQHASEVGDGFSLTLRLLSGSRLSDNARAAISDNDAIAYLGELAPGASEQTVGITNAEDVLQVSPTDTALELTQASAAVSASPKAFYESLGSYGRTFARVVPTSALEAKADVAEMKRLGMSRLAVGSDGSDYGRAMALAIRQDAAASGLTVGSAATAQAYFYASPSVTATGHAFSAALGANASLALFAPSAAASASLPAAISPAPKRLYVSVPGFAAGSLTGAGAALFTQFTTSYGIGAYNAMFGYEAMDAVLDTLHQAGKDANNRTQVVKDFLAIKDRADGVLPSFSIEGGNTTLSTFVFLGLRHGALAPVGGTVTG